MFRLITTTLILTLFSCSQEAGLSFYKLSGPTMGSTYHITVQCKDIQHIQTIVDSILSSFDASMSLYAKQSTIISFNQADEVFCFDPNIDTYFEPIFKKSKEIYSLTKGTFDPSIAPLVNFYGFGYKEKKHIEKTDTAQVSALKKLLVFDKLTIIDSTDHLHCIRKPSPEFMLDFNAISAGFVVDVIYQKFQLLGLKNFMINMSGEIRTKGQNERNEDWIIGINKPSEKADEYSVELPLKISNRAIATSGNYRNSYESKGQKFAHIIDPRTGLSKPSDILSATVIADDCATADALATAFMVMGLKDALHLANELKNVDATFIFDQEGDGIFEFMTSTNMSKYYLNNEQ